MPTFTIIYDTYCGWCYGAGPVLEALVHTGKVELYHRYLFQGANAYRMGDGFGTQAAVIDARIHALTGQPFGKAYKRNILRSEDEVLESGLSAQAAYLIHDLGPEIELKLAQALQHGYFVEGRSTQDATFVAETLARLGLNSQRLGAADVVEGTRSRAADAEQISRLAGCQGVPTVLRHAETTEIINLSEFYNSPTDISHLAA
ncbi:DsbA family protein [Aliiroseovarius sp. 2305UL8-7]|uniref:DsbA family protein n=1 Tax=Aliiroseovarius conchicola TaxID=3121637 RepID=UPI00352899AD